MNISRPAKSAVSISRPVAHVYAGPGAIPDVVNLASAINANAKALEELQRAVVEEHDKIHAAVLTVSEAVRKLADIVEVLVKVMEEDG